MDDRYESLYESAWWMQCTNCDETWPESIWTPAKFDAFIKRLESTCCPRCGADHEWINIRTDARKTRKELVFDKSIIKRSHKVCEERAWDPAHGDEADAAEAAGHEPTST